MYKKITHTITEEHFDHPIAAEIKRVIGDTKNRPMMAMPTVVSATQFKSDIANYFTAVDTQLKAIISNIASGNTDAVTAAEDELFRIVDTWGNLSKPYYGTEFGEKINQIMRTLALTMIVITKNLRDGLDITNWVTRLSYPVAGDLTQLLTNYNNTQWQYNTINGVLTKLTTNLVDTAKAIVSKDAATASVASDSVKAELELLAKTFADGVIQQHPNLFSA